MEHGLLIISTSADEGIRKSTDERVHVYISYVCTYVYVYIYIHVYIYILMYTADKGVGGGGGGVGGIKITVAGACRASD